MALDMLETTATTAAAQLGKRPRLMHLQAADVHFATQRADTAAPQTTERVRIGLRLPTVIILTGVTRCTGDWWDWVGYSIDSG